MFSEGRIEECRKNMKEKLKPEKRKEYGVKRVHKLGWDKEYGTRKGKKERPARSGRSEK